MIIAFWIRSVSFVTYSFLKAVINETFEEFAKVIKDLKLYRLAVNSLPVKSMS